MITDVIRQKRNCWRLKNILASFPFWQDDYVKYMIILKYVPPHKALSLLLFTNDTLYLHSVWHSWDFVKVKSLFWVHIQAQSSALQTLTSTFPGHWAFTLHIHLDIHLNSLGSMQPLTRHLAPRLTNLPSQVPTLLLGREKQCSVKCLAQGHNEQTPRPGIELGTWPRS